MGLQVTLKNGRVVPITDRQLSKLFWPRFREMPDGCLEWTGRIDQDYGRFRVSWDRQKADIGIHRVAWIIRHGPIPVGMTVDHTCFNTLCGNPEHLRLLTLEDNSRNRRNVMNCGHPPTPENTYIRRYPNGSTGRGCLTCRRAWWHKHDAIRRPA